MHNLANFYQGQGKSVEAELLRKQTLVLQKKVFGEEHHATLISMHNLVTIYQEQGKSVEAELLQKQTMVLQKKVLSKKHTDTLDSMYSVFTAHHEGNVIAYKPLQKRRNLPYWICSTLFKTVIQILLDCCLTLQWILDFYGCVFLVCSLHRLLEC